MNRRAIVVIGLMLLGTAGFGGTRAGAQSAPVTELRVEWEAVARGDKALLRGYVYNQQQMRVERVRLRVEQLDANARPVATRSTWIPGEIAYRDRAYFELTVPVAAAHRVTIESFDRSMCGNG